MKIYFCDNRSQIHSIVFDDLTTVKEYQSETIDIHATHANHRILHKLVIKDKAIATALAKYIEEGVPTAFDLTTSPIYFLQQIVDLGLETAMEDHASGLMLSEVIDLLSRPNPAPNNEDDDPRPVEDVPLHLLQYMYEIGYKFGETLSQTKKQQKDAALTPDE